MWWGWGIPVAWATSALLLVADHLHGSGHGGWGSLLDLARLLIYWEWLRLAWRCSSPAAAGAWTLPIRGMLAAGLVVNALV